MRIVVGAAIGAASGFVMSILQLTYKRARNARLMARGEPPIRDCLRIAWELPGAVTGVIVAIVTVVAS